MSAIDDLTADSRLDISYLNRRINDWRDRLRSLYADIESWLPGGWAVESMSDVTMNEELMKAHAIPASPIPTLSLQNGIGDRASLRPKGLWIIGANGRVDLHTPVGRYIIVDVAENFAPPQWKVSSQENRSRLQTLDRDFVQAALS